MAKSYKKGILLNDGGTRRFNEQGNRMGQELAHSRSRTHTATSYSCPACGYQLTKRDKYRCPVCGYLLDTDMWYPDELTDSGV